MNRVLAGLFLVLFSFNTFANDTGAWHDPTQDGHGISLHEFDGNRLFWWFANHSTFGQTWLMSSVETSENFVLYRPTSNAFPVGASVDVGDPVGTATMVKLNSGELLFQWDILVEGQTCADLYGMVPAGPLDPRCRDEEDRFTPSRVLVEEFNEEGSARFQRLTPQ